MQRVLSWEEYTNEDLHTVLSSSTSGNTLHWQIQDIPDKPAMETSLIIRGFWVQSKVIRMFNSN